MLTSLFDFGWLLATLKYQYVLNKQKAIPYQVDSVVEVVFFVALTVVVVNSIHSATVANVASRYPTGQACELEIPRFIRGKKNPAIKTG
jgi:hypothetical protein